MKLDEFRILSVAIISMIFALIIYLIHTNTISDRYIEAQKREYFANLKAEHERKLAAKRIMAESQPKRSVTDCAKSLRAIQTKRAQLLKKSLNPAHKSNPNVIVSFLVCEKNLTWLDGNHVPVPLEFEPGRHCHPGEQHLYSMFGCPFEMILVLPGPF